MNKNSRKFVRFKLYPSAYEALLNTPKGVINAGIHDIGQGGAGILMEDAVSIGQKAELIVLIKDQTYTFKATVAWLNSLEESYSFKVGLNFDEADHSKALKVIETISQAG